MIIAAEGASLKRANLIYVGYMGRIYLKPLFTAVHCGRAQSEMRDELFTTQAFYYPNTYFSLPLLYIGLKEYDRKYVYKNMYLPA